ncbi:hypothetical protein [Lentilactobacillus sp. SPB1-3]|uniref:Uncharacterized protein n=1 Tax=Lentilactobacillus terminaliae TaxID=3003483 RepID=A0ACD5DEI9_9LACO|nr:hypothetical protein [Lentilactobacillus sp. SPB1-3]MCZ0977458.1 hypothetical protein [Lentilactobacillus sp. SPB1-3]
MKKVILWGTIVLGMFGIFMTSNTTANAATWHGGVPTFLKSGFWKSNKSEDFFIKFSNPAIYFISDEDSVDIFDGGTIANPRYKKTGKKYIIDNKNAKKQNIISTIRRISKNKAIYHMIARGDDNITTHITRIAKLP